MIYCVISSSEPNEQILIRIALRKRQTQHAVSIGILHRVCRYATVAKNTAFKANLLSAATRPVKKSYMKNK